MASNGLSPKQLSCSCAPHSCSVTMRVGTLANRFTEGKFLARALKCLLEKAQTSLDLLIHTHIRVRVLVHTHTHFILKNNFYLQHLSYRLESGGSNPTSSDSYSDRASARARREAREARLASLTSRVEEDSNRDYKKVGSFSWFPVLSLWYINLLAFPQ